MTAQFVSGKMPSWKSQLLFSLSLVFMKNPHELLKVLYTFASALNEM